MKAEDLERLPDHPGVYLMKDAGGRVIYVGKANSLRKRVRSYFGRRHESARLRALVSRIWNVETFLVDSELEALLLELNLIKEHRPRYNVRLKDDKRYPYIEVTLGEPFPRVFGTRRPAAEGSLLFGPYTDAQAMHRVLRLIRQVFPVRSCTAVLPSRAVRLCFDYQIKKCSGPCEGKASEEEYRQMIDRVILLLKGKNRTLVEELRREMARASEDRLYEKAAILRDQIAAVERVIERQRMSASDPADRDVVALSEGDGELVAVLLRVREGKMTGKETFPLQAGAEEEALGPFLKRLYEKAPAIPPEILADREAADRETIEAWLASRAGFRVRLLVPSRGEKKRLVDLARANAAHERQALLVRKLARKDRSFEALREIRRALELARIPRRIECFDCSNLGDRDLVGSSVSFRDGLPEKARYRRYRIRTVKGIDDVASIGEIVGRRFRRLLAEGDPLPDLVLVDGGKGQLAAACAALREAGAEGTEAASLAKREEEVFRPGVSEAIRLPNGPGLRLLQRIRDEAHRFAITYQRRRRAEGTERSALDAVPGLGAERKRALLLRFGSVARVRAATAIEIARVRGIGPILAERIRAHLRGAER
ncbi:MAG: excinuclease ABC subunit UvrC [Candidatus Eisenbacteria bacterium]|nr:excinuclease ABC subunit UvrC [Candidatus Eisenbacteria bacterium]